MILEGAKATQVRGAVVFFFFFLLGGASGPYLGLSLPKGIG